MVAQLIAGAATIARKDKLENALLTNVSVEVEKRFLTLTYTREMFC